MRISSLPHRSSLPEGGSRCSPVEGVGPQTGPFLFLTGVVPRAANRIKWRIKIAALKRIENC